MRFDNYRHDMLRDRIAAFAAGLRLDELPPEAVAAARARLVDTLAAALGGLDDPAAVIARRMATPDDRSKTGSGAHLIGTDRTASPEAAAFANAIAVRGVDTLDAWHHNGRQGHPADVIAPLVTLADCSGASGGALIVATVIAYDLFGWLRDASAQEGFDNTNCARLAAAVAGARLVGLGADGIGHALALAAAQDNAVKEVRSRPAVMTRNTAAGHQARGAVSAVLMAAAGVRGPGNGVEAWFDQVAGGRGDPATLPGRWRILASWIKLRAIPGVAYPLVIAAEKLAPACDATRIERVEVEVYGKLFKGFGKGEERWAPDSRDTADHSAPYIVAAILQNGPLTLRSFDPEAYLDPATRALMARVRVAENESFTQAYKTSHAHCARITVIRTDGTRQVAESGGDTDDFSAPKTDAQVSDKFRWLAGPALGDRTESALAAWWQVDRAAAVGPLVVALRRA